MAKDFKPTTVFGDRIAVNDEDETFVVYPIKVSLFKAIPSLFKYDELNSFDIIEDGNTVKGGLARAAVVGASTGKTKKTVSEYKIKLNLNSLRQPYYNLDIMLGETKKNSLIFKQSERDMNDAVAGLQHIIDSKDDKQTPSSNLGDLRELKALLDDGIITQQEFDTKKTQILNI